MIDKASSKKKLPSVCEADLINMLRVEGDAPSGASTTEARSEAQPSRWQLMREHNFWMKQTT